jgi:hypothetical protein
MPLVVEAKSLEDFCGPDTAGLQHAKGNAQSCTDTFNSTELTRAYIDTVRQARDEMEPRLIELEDFCEGPAQREFERCKHKLISGRGCPPDWFGAYTAGELSKAKFQRCKDVFVEVLGTDECVIAPECAGIEE